MSRRSRRAAQSRQGCLPGLIIALAVIAFMLVTAIAVTHMLVPSEDEQVVQEVGSGQYVDVSRVDASEQALVLNAASYEEASEREAAVAVTPTPTPAPMATLGSDAVGARSGLGDVAPTATAEGFLPIYKKANTDEMAIAITVDECSGVTITKSISKMAYYYGARLTLFPTGDNVMRKGMGAVLKTCVDKLGFEIENRCYSTISRLYNMTDSMMCMEIWKQTIALDYVMNVKYQPHFLRLYGGNGENDLRTHGYLRQLGYYGIASYTYNGSAMEADKLVDTLAPGNIYVFKSNKTDAEKMNRLMKAAKAGGYRMVTMNELFGYEPNEQMPVEGNILAEVMPELGNYNNHFYFMKTGDCTWAVYQLQRRLVELGYLPPGTVDGVFGDSTAQVLSLFQAKCGLAATGAADPITQQRLFSADAPEADVRATVADLARMNEEKNAAEAAKAAEVEGEGDFPEGE